MSLEGLKVYIHGRLRGLTKRRIAELAGAAGAKMSRRLAGATLVVVGHSSVGGSLCDDGDIDLGTHQPGQAPLISERRFKDKLGLLSPSAEGDRTYSAAQLARHAGLSPQKLRALTLYDVLDPVEETFSYRDLVVARMIGRLCAAGAPLPKVVAAALSLEQHGVDLATARLSEASWGEIVQEIEGRPARLDGQLLLPLEGDDLDADEAFDRAEASESEGDLSTARRWYELAARLDRKDGVILFNLGNVLDALGETREAEIAYLQAIARNPDLGDAWFNLGVMQEKVGRYEDALASYTNALSIEPTFGDALYNAAALCMRLKRFETALALWEQLAKTTTEGAAEAKRLAHLCRLELRQAAVRG
jgi:tetratricopeptide (TPR) repeat protein